MTCLRHRLLVLASWSVFFSAAVLSAEPASPAPFKLPREPLRHGNLVSAIAFSPDGRVLASAGWDKVVRLWDVETGKQLHQLEGHQAEIECVAFAPDGKTVASGSWDKTIRLWDVSTGKEIRKIGEHPDGVLSLAFAPDGKTLASGNQDRTGRTGSLHLWDVANGTGIVRFAGHSTPVTALVFAADGKTLASGGVDSRVCRCDTATGRLLQEMRGHQGWVHAVAFSADGQALASAGADKTIRLWDTATGKETRLFQGHQDKVRTLAFSLDNRMLLSGSFDRTIRLWEIATGKERRSLTGHLGGVRTVALVPDGSGLASGSSDGTIRFFPVYAPPDPTRPPAQREAKELEALWTSLTDDDATRAFQAVTALIQSADQGVPFLQERLRLGAKIDDKRLKQLIADLDHDQFAMREQATQELEKLGDLAEESLRQALKDTIAAEARRRIEGILEKLAGPMMTPDRLRQMRAVEVLENAGTAEARQVLQKLAEGASGARLTREAQGALQRLVRGR